MNTYSDMVGISNRIISSSISISYYIYISISISIQGGAIIGGIEGFRGYGLF
jgi:hypothetical protein